MNILRYFEHARERQASDLHLISGNPPILRVSGELFFLDEPVLEGEKLRASIYDQILTPSQRERIEEDWDLDFAFEQEDVRFRTNIRFGRQGIALSSRLIPKTIPTPEAIRLEETAKRLPLLHDGLIVVSGPSGSGKSTTLATMIDLINERRSEHIITLEDPIEFVWQRKKSIIEQREISQNVKTFAQGLKYALRQDPNVLLVGEMRDLETIAATLTAAETGHLVFSTLHTSGAAATVERIVDVFPPHQQRQILIQLASTLKAVISQQLFPKKGGGVVVAREILIVTPAVSNLIRENKIPQITSVIQTSGKLGMVTAEKAIEQLIEEGFIDEAAGKRRMKNFEL